jgi:hypothetical protein
MHNSNLSGCVEEAVSINIASTPDNSIELTSLVSNHANSRAAVFAIKRAQQQAHDQALSAQYECMDLEAEVKDIIGSGVARYYNKTCMRGPQRIALSMMAEKFGLAAYNADDDGTSSDTSAQRKHKQQQKFMIGPPRKAPILFDHSYMSRFGQWVGHDFRLTLSEAEFHEQVAFRGLSRELQLFRDEVAKYGLQGMKRRDELMTTHIIDSIAAMPAYIANIKNENPARPIVLMRPTDKPFSIMKTVFSKDNDGKVFLSLDIRSAVFKGYRDAGVFSESSWEDFVRKFTPSPIVAQNKALRMRIFGKLNVNHKNEILIANTTAPIMRQLQLHAANSDIPARILACEGDEIIIKSNNQTASTDVQWLRFLSLGNDVRISCYRVHPIQIGDATFFLRDFLYHADKKPVFSLGIPDADTYEIYTDIKCVPQPMQELAYKNAADKVNVLLQHASQARTR